MDQRELYNKQTKVFDEIQQDVTELRKDFDEKMKRKQTGQFLDKQIAEDFFIRALDLYKKYESITHKDFIKRKNILISQLTRLYSEIALEFDLGEMTKDEAAELLKRFPISSSFPEFQELRNALTKKLSPPAEGGGGGGGGGEEPVPLPVPVPVPPARETEAAQAQALAAKQIAEQAAAALQQALAEAEAQKARLQQQLEAEKAEGEKLREEASARTKISTDALQLSISLRKESQQREEEAKEGKRAAEEEARLEKDKAAAAEAEAAARVRAAEAEAAARVRAAQGEVAAAEAEARAAQERARTSAEQAVIGEAAAARAEQEARKIQKEIERLQGELGKNQRKIQEGIEKASEESRKAKSCEKQLKALSLIVEADEEIQNQLSIALKKQAERERERAAEAEAALAAERARAVAALEAARREAAQEQARTAAALEAARREAAQEQARAVAALAAERARAAAAEAAQAQAAAALAAERERAAQAEATALRYAEARVKTAQATAAAAQATAEVAETRAAAAETKAQYAEAFTQDLKEAIGEKLEGIDKERAAAEAQIRALEAQAEELLKQTREQGNETISNLTQLIRTERAAALAEISELKRQVTYLEKMFDQIKEEIRRICYPSGGGGGGDGDDDDGSGGGSGGGGDPLEPIINLKNNYNNFLLLLLGQLNSLNETINDCNKLYTFFTSPRILNDPNQLKKGNSVDLGLDERQDAEISVVIVENKGDDSGKMQYDCIVFGGKDVKTVPYTFKKNFNNKYVAFNIVPGNLASLNRYNEKTSETELVNDLQAQITDFLASLSGSGGAGSPGGGFGSGGGGFGSGPPPPPFSGNDRTTDGFGSSSAAVAPSAPTSSSSFKYPFSYPPPSTPSTPSATTPIGSPPTPPPSPTLLSLSADVASSVVDPTAPSASSVVDPTAPTTPTASSATTPSASSATGPPSAPTASSLDPLPRSPLLSSPPSSSSLFATPRVLEKEKQSALDAANEKISTCDKTVDSILKIFNKRITDLTTKELQIIRNELKEKEGFTDTEINNCLESQRQRLQSYYLSRPEARPENITDSVENIGLKNTQKARQELIGLQTQIDERLRMNSEEIPNYEKVYNLVLIEELEVRKQLLQLRFDDVSSNFDMYIQNFIRLNTELLEKIRQRTQAEELVRTKIAEEPTASEKERERLATAERERTAEAVRLLLQQPSAESPPRDAAEAKAQGYTEIIPDYLERVAFGDLLEQYNRQKGQAAAAAARAAAVAAEAAAAQAAAAVAAEEEAARRQNFFEEKTFSLEQQRIANFQNQMAQQQRESEERDRRQLQKIKEEAEAARQAAEAAQAEAERARQSAEAATAEAEAPGFSEVSLDESPRPQQNKVDDPNDVIQNKLALQEKSSGATLQKPLTLEELEQLQAAVTKPYVSISEEAAEATRLAREKAQEAEANFNRQQEERRERDLVEVRRLKEEAERKKREAEEAAARQAEARAREEAARQAAAEAERNEQRRIAKELNAEAAITALQEQKRKKISETMERLKALEEDLKRRKEEREAAAAQAAAAAAARAATAQEKEEDDFSGAAIAPAQAAAEATIQKEVNKLLLRKTDPKELKILVINCSGDLDDPDYNVGAKKAEFETFFNLPIKNPIQYVAPIVFGDKTDDKWKGILSSLQRTKQYYTHIVVYDDCENYDFLNTIKFIQGVDDVLERDGLVCYISEKRDDINNELKKRDTVDPFQKYFFKSYIPDRNGGLQYKLYPQIRKIRQSSIQSSSLSSFPPLPSSPLTLEKLNEDLLKAQQIVNNLESISGPNRGGSGSTFVTTRTPEQEQELRAARADVETLQKAIKEKEAEGEGGGGGATAPAPPPPLPAPAPPSPPAAPAPPVLSPEQQEQFKQLEAQAAAEQAARKAQFEKDNPHLADQQSKLDKQGNALLEKQKQLKNALAKSPAAGGGGGGLTPEQQLEQLKAQVALGDDIQYKQALIANITTNITKLIAERERKRGDIYELNKRLGIQFGKKMLSVEEKAVANQLKARMEGEIKGLDEDIKREKGKIEIVKQQLEALGPAPEPAPPAGGGAEAQSKKGLWPFWGGRKQKTISKNKKKKKNITKRKY